MVIEHQRRRQRITARLGQALRQTPGAALAEWRGQRRCAEAWGELVRLDASPKLQLRAGPLEIWLEHDRSTETHARLQEKLDRYDELAPALEQPITLLLTLTSDRREQEARRTPHL